MKYGTLYIIATPIGNLDDITIRAIKTLKEVKVISCEDTRVTSKLCNIHNIECKGKLISYHEHNAHKMLPKIIDKLKDGTDVGFVSDAGTPLISDPGFKLVKKAIQDNIPVKSIPGPSALTAAISISGISSDQFNFYGFLPKKKAQRLKKIRAMSALDASAIIFESSKRVAATLSEVYAILGNRNISIVREITKKTLLKRDNIYKLALEMKNDRKKND